MTIGIIVAMRKELDLLLPLLTDIRETVTDGFNFYQGRIAQNQIVAMQCGIGKVNAAMGALTLINHYRPQRVINTGVAGGADSKVSVMHIVVARQTAYHDVWCGPESPWGVVQGLPLYYDAPDDLMQLVPQRDDLHVGLICSGDQFIDSIERIRAIKEKFPQALAVDMESAAIAQVCHVRGVGFMSMRVISDSPGAGHDNTKQYNDFWQDAPQQTFHVLQQMLQRIH
ncbi:MAG: 5'-methylthioadenosine/adenosylhomocysteine nucleosidase [Muribaculaceae bacterium]|nr:5'-methylthioadenosine/adenosylhomocysteine nucleosidase [Muribaculaceae bacterium]